MNYRRIAALVAAVAFVLAGVYALAPGVFGVGPYDRTTVSVADGTGTPTTTAADVETTTETLTASTTTAGTADTDAESASATPTATGEPPADAGSSTVAAHDANGSTLATIDVRIADTYTKRYTGLSNTESLANGSGMLFVHDEASTHAYVMRDMDFPLDIVFVAPNGTITRIHHAELPPEGREDLRRYRGYGKYVLEVPYGYTNRTGIDEGDRLVIDGDY